MAKILIVDDQEWVVSLCKECLARGDHQVSVTDDIDDVRKQVLTFEPHIVLLNQYLKHGALVWDVLQDIKRQEPNLPVLIVTEYDTHLFCSRLLEADGYLVKSQTAAAELREKISALAGKNSIGRPKDAQIHQCVAP